MLIAIKKLIVFFGGGGNIMRNWQFNCVFVAGFGIGGILFWVYTPKWF